MFLSNFVVVLFLIFFIVSVNFVKSQHNGFGFFEKVFELDQSLTSKQKEEARKIGTNSSATKQEIVDGLKKFFHEIGGEPEEKFNEVAELYNTKMKEIREKIKENQSSLKDEETKEIFKKAGKIHRNMNITFGEERKQLKKLFKNVSPEIKRKIEEIFWTSTKQHKTSNN
uniref:Uncharacterized protein n=1 Tax=Panagrolaimus sp. PS1159 TaxID=55785 RepID=A0AC35GFQ7_9BILA